MSKGPPAKLLKNRARETQAPLLRAAMLRRLPRRTTATGEVRLAAAPGLLDHYVQMLGSIFGALGRQFNAQELAHLRGILQSKMQEGFAASPYAKLVIRYHTEPLPKTSLTYNVALEMTTLADEYATWVRDRTPPLFGSHPDAKVLALATELGAAGMVPVLDAGAGTGRNTIPLAQAGYATDAVELAPALAAVLREEVARHGLSAVRVFEGDVFDPALELPTGHYGLIVLAEVVASHFRDASELRRLFELAARLLRPSGLLVFSAFLSSDGYKPDALVRELSQVFWCCLFTRRELADAVGDLPFDRISDESVAEYEQAHQAPEHWPPTGWFHEWAGGRDLFDLPEGKPPLELRWLVYRLRARP